MRRILQIRHLENEMEAEFRRQVAGVVWLGFLALGILLIGTTEALRWPWQTHLLALALILLSVLVRVILPHGYLLGVWLLVLGSMGIDLLSFLWVPSGAALYVLALPASAAALLMGSTAGLAVAGLCTVIALVTAASPAASYSQATVPALIVIWGATGLTCVSSYFSGQTTESLWMSYSHMRKLLEEARNQRLELKQTQADLVQANAELARLSERLSQMYQ
ncbi:MAG: hypothetical protein QME94_03005, partial [Anaerolineae bacterium]|nr:hypothetical protein [Anaerolineae bacterium]